MKFALKALALIALLCMGLTALADVTVGDYNTGNCYPFLCNDSGTDTGVAIDYQQAYSHNAFTGTITITSLQFAYASQFGGGSTMLDGTYDIYLGYSANPFNGLSSNQVANRGTGWSLVDSFTVSGNGCDFNPVCSINLSTSFTYDPSMGDLLLEIIATDQANVPNGTGNGYIEADENGLVIGRNYCLGGSDCQFGTVDGIGLVTTFGTNQQTPEPGTLALLGTGILGIVSLRKRTR